MLRLAVTMYAKQRLASSTITVRASIPFTSVTYTKHQLGSEVTTNNSSSSISISVDNPLTSSSLLSSSASPLPLVSADDSGGTHTHRWTPRAVEDDIRTFSGKLWKQRHASRRGNSAATHSRPRGDEQEDERAAAEDLVEIKHLLDYIIQSVHPHKQRWISGACQLALRAGLPQRCGEIFFSISHVSMHPRSLELSSLPGLVLQAAVAAQDLHSLEQCVSLVEAWRQSQDLYLSAIRPSNTVSWKVDLVVLHALRIFGAAALIAGNTNRRSHPDNNNHSEVMASLRAIMARVIPILMPPCSAAENEQLLDTAIRHAMYNASDHLGGLAAIYFSVFQQWRQKGNDTDGPTRWLTNAALYVLFGGAVHARRWGIAARLSLEVDAHLLLVHPGREEAPARTLDRTDDALVGLMLRYLQATSGVYNGEAMRWLHALRHSVPDYLPSPTVVREAVKLAGATHDVECASWCLGALLNTEQVHPPTSVDLFECVCDCARAGMANLPGIIASLAENGLVSLSDEELLYIQLLKCRRSIRWREEVEELLEVCVASDVVASTRTQRRDPSSSSLSSAASSATIRALYTPRNVYMVLLILLEGEHEAFMRYYRFFMTHHAVHASVEHRAKWLVFALVWLTTQAGTCGKEDVAYVSREAKQILASAALIAPSLQRDIEAKWELVLAQYPQQRRYAAAAAAAPASASSSPGRVPREGETGRKSNPPPALVRFVRYRHRLKTAVPPSELFADITFSLGDGDGYGSPPGVSLERGQWSRCVRGIISI